MNSPTHLQLATHPSIVPEATSHRHQGLVNGLLSSSLEKRTKQRTVPAVKKRSGESRRIRRDWAVRAFSNRIMNPPRIEVVTVHVRARRVRYVVGTSRTPSSPVNSRIDMYGISGVYSLGREQKNYVCQLYLA